MKRVLTRYLFILACTAIMVVLASIYTRWQSHAPIVRSGDGRVLKVGWDNTTPLPSMVPRRGASGFTQGDMDFYIVNAAAGELGWRVEWVPGSWVKLLADLKSGQIDALAQANQTPQRQEFAHFSQPYFQTTYATFTRRENASSTLFSGSVPTLEALVKDTESGALKIGVIKGYAGSSAVQAVIDNADVRRVEFGSEQQALRGVANHDVDWYVSNMLEGAVVMQRDAQLSQQLHMEPLTNLAAYSHVMFSKATVTLPEVAEFNKSLQTLKDNGQASRIVRSEYYPALLLFVNRILGINELFVIGVLAMALTGIVIAHREGYSLVGAVLLAAAPGVGGGLIRDLVLGRMPPSISSDSAAIGVVLIAVLLGWIFYKLLVPRLPKDLQSKVNTFELAQSPLFIFLESIGLASFAVVGVLIAMDMRAEPLWLWGPFAAALTGSGGGILRELLRGNHNIATIRGRVHIELLLGWALFLSLALMFLIEHPPHDPFMVQLTVATTVLGVLVTRWVVLRRGWTSPMY